MYKIRHFADRYGATGYVYSETVKFAFDFKVHKKKVKKPSYQTSIICFTTEKINRLFVSQ